jgi:DNA-binding MarR family transcriptional regulator
MGRRSVAAHAAMSAAESDDIARMALAASRVPVTVAARSLAAADAITIPQFRALVLRATRGPQQPVDLAAALALTSSSVTRLRDRLINKGLISRDREVTSGTRRAVRVVLSAAGRQLADEVTACRAAAIREIVDRIPADAHPALVEAFETFAAAAGELPAHDASARWAL